jgi:hypothetical protein
MDAPDRWERWGPVSGLVFVAAFLLLFFLFFVPEDLLPADVDGEQILEFYRAQGAGGFLLMYSLIAVAGAALLWFAGSLRASLRRIEPAPGRLSAVGFGGGVACGTLLLSGGAALLAPFAFAIFGTAERPLDPSMYDLVEGIGFTSINLALIAEAVMIVAASLVILRWGGLPRWFAWVGLVVALALILNVLYFFGLFVWPAWVLLASVVLLLQPVAGTPEVRSATGPP